MSRGSARLRALAVLGAMALALASVVMGVGGARLERASAQTPDTCVPPESTIPGTPTSVPVCETTTTTPPTTAKPTPTTAKPKPTTTTTKPKPSPTTTAPAGGQQGPPADGSGGGPAGGAGAPPGGGPPTVGGSLPFVGAPPGGTVSPLQLGANLPGYSLVPGSEALGPAGVALAPDTRTTAPILALLTSLHLPQRVLNRLFAPYPVAGKAVHPAAPSGPGVDISADPGTPVVVSLEGTLHLDPGPGPGQRTAVVTGVDGTLFTDSHLDGFAPELVEGQHVSVGDALGFVGGPTGPGDPPHIHFDIRLKGGPSTDPVPYLDRWLTQALNNAETLTGRGGKHKAPPSVSNAAKGATTSNAAAITPGAATMLPGLGMAGFGIWFGITRLMRRRREEGLGSDLAVEFAGPVDFASKFVIRPPAPGRRQPRWSEWQAQLQPWLTRLRERRFPWQ